MTTWSQIWNGKTRPVKHLSAPEKKTNGKSDDYDEIADLEDKIEALEKERDEYKKLYEDCNRNLLQSEMKLQFYEKYLIDKTTEVNNYRSAHVQSLEFMQRVIMDLVNRPVTATAAVPQTAAERLAAARAATNKNTNAADTSNPTAGPTGKLP